MKSKPFNILPYLLMILCVLFGIGSGIYIEFVDNSRGDDNTINWKKGFFRLAVVLSVILSILGGAYFARLAKKGESDDEDDEDPLEKKHSNPQSVFFGISLVIFGFVWLVYFILQWPIYYIVIFILKGFSS